MKPEQEERAPALESLCCAHGYLLQGSGVGAGLAGQGRHYGRGLTPYSRTRDLTKGLEGKYGKI